tara:strand:+ start:2221 stop:3066 length:846 start_codon:yes stop_codon:yes gene_type:complete
MMIDVNQFTDLIIAIRPIGIFLIVLISFLRPFAGGLRASLTFNELGELSLIDATKGYVLSMYGSIFLPSAIGGDILRIEHMSRVSGESRKTAFTVVGAERGAGLLSLIAITIALSLFVDNRLGYDKALSLMLISLSLVSIVGLFVARKVRPTSSIGKIIAPLTQLSNPISVAKVLSLSFFFQLFTLSVPIVVAFIVGDFDIALGIALLTPLVAIISTIPISIGGLGLREASYVGMSSMVGVSTEIAFLCGISLSSSLVLSGLPGVIIQKDLFSINNNYESE